MAFGFLLAFECNVLLRLWRQSEDRKRRDKATEILRRHGLTPQFYVRTTQKKDPELEWALDTFTHSGYVVTNAQNVAIGNRVPTVSKAPVGLRLVVSR